METTNDNEKAAMAGEWIETTVGKQATLQRGVDITKVSQRNGTTPVVSSGGVSNYHDTSAATGPGVILGRKGVVGSVYYMPRDYWPHDTTLWVNDFHGNNPRFVYYFFRPIPIVAPPAPVFSAFDSLASPLYQKIVSNERQSRTLASVRDTLLPRLLSGELPVKNAQRTLGRAP